MILAKVDLYKELSGKGGLYHNNTNNFKLRIRHPCSKRPLDNPPLGVCQEPQQPMKFPSWVNLRTWMLSFHFYSLPHVVSPRSCSPLPTLKSPPCILESKSVFFNPCPHSAGLPFNIQTHQGSSRTEASPTKRNILVKAAVGFFPHKDFSPCYIFIRERGK